MEKMNKEYFNNFRRNNKKYEYSIASVKEALNR